MIYYWVYVFLNTKYKNICLKNDIGVHIFFSNKVIFHVLKTSTCTCYILYLYCSLYMIIFYFVCIVLSNETNIMWINCILWFLLIILLVDIVGVLIDNLKHLFVCLIMRLLKKLHKKLGYGTGSEEIFLHYNNKQDGNKT